VPARALIGTTLAGVKFLASRRLNLRYRIIGADVASGKERTTIVEAPSESDALRIAKQQGLFTSEITPLPDPPRVVPPLSVNAPPSIIASQFRPLYTYKMVQVPPTIVIREQRGSEAAAYLEGVVNHYAAEGWEFYRVDSIGVVIPAGCLGELLGQSAQRMEYYVVTMRRPLGDAS
jgi:hypothetical protein